MVRLVKVNFRFLFLLSCLIASLAQLVIARSGPGEEMNSAGSIEQLPGKRHSVLKVPNMNYDAADKSQLAYDLYAPADYKKVAYPIYIWIHGGGWAIGDKSDWLSVNMSAEAAALGFVVFDINYRLASSKHPAPYPVAPDDIAAFIRYLRNNMSKFNATANTKISIGGHSAGGYLALMQASDNTSSFRYACVVDIAGVTDLSAHDLPKILRPYIDAFVPDISRRRDASPIARLNSTRFDNVLFVHAQDDPAVPISQSISMELALENSTRSVGIYTNYPINGGHDIMSVTTNAAIDGYLPLHCK